MGSPVASSDIPPKTATLIWMVSGLKAFGWLVGVATVTLGSLFVDGDAGAGGDRGGVGLALLAVVFVAGLLLIAGQVIWAMQERLDRLMIIAAAHALVDASMAVLSILTGAAALVVLYGPLAAAQAYIAHSVRQAGAR